MRTFIRFFTSRTRSLRRRVDFAHHSFGGIRPVIANIGFRLSGRVVTLVASTLVNVLVARVWGAEEFGFYASITVLAGFFGFLFNLGMADLLFREISSDRAAAPLLLSGALSLMLLAWLPASLVVVAATVLLMDGGLSTVGAALAAAAWMVTGAINTALMSVYLASERMGLELRSGLIERLFVLVAAVTIVTQTQSVPLLLCGLASARAVTAWVNARTVRSMIGGFGMRFDKRQIWLNLKHGTPFWIHTFFTGLYIQPAILLLTAFATLREVGLYRSANVLPNQSVVLPVALNAAVFPRLVRRWAEGDHQGVVRGVRASLALTTFSGALVGLSLAALSGILIPSLYGEGFRPAVPVLALLAIGLPFAFANNSLGMMLTIAGRQRHRALISAFGAAVAIAVNLALIPRFGMMGAAAAAPIVEALVVGALAVACWPILRSANATVQPINRKEMPDSEL